MVDHPARVEPFWLAHPTLHVDGSPARLDRHVPTAGVVLLDEDLQVRLDELEQDLCMADVHTVRVVVANPERVAELLGMASRVRHLELRGRLPTHVADTLIAATVSSTRPVRSRRRPTPGDSRTSSGTS